MNLHHDHWGRKLGTFEVRKAQLVIFINCFRQEVSRWDPEELIYDSGGYHYGMNQYLNKVISTHTHYPKPFFVGFNLHMYIYITSWMYLHVEMAIHYPWLSRGSSTSLGLTHQLEVISWILGPWTWIQDDLFHSHLFFLGELDDDDDDDDDDDIFCFSLVLFWNKKTNKQNQAIRPPPENPPPKRHPTCVGGEPWFTWCHRTKGGCLALETYQGICREGGFR